MTRSLHRAAPWLALSAACVTLIAGCRTAAPLPTPRELTQAEDLQRSLVRNGAENRVPAELVTTTAAIRATREGLTAKYPEQYITDMAQIALRAAQTAEVRDQAVRARRATDSLTMRRLERLVGTVETRQAELQGRIDSLRRANDATKEQLNAALTQLRSLSTEVTSLRETSRGTTYTLGDQLFDANKTSLKKTSTPEIQRIAVALRGYPQRQISIEGHMDPGPQAQTLSEGRAAVVRAALVKAGVDPSQLSSRGLGATQPVAQGTTPEARRANRRVDVIVVAAGKTP
jgi:outer membrane protein OmpA-like peptidoglycan-associated protein